MAYKKEVLIIDLGSYSTKLMHVAYPGTGIKILAYEQKEVQALRRDSAELAVDFVWEFLKKHAVAAKKVIVTISQIESVEIKYITLPVMPEAEVQEAVKWQIKEDLHFPVEQANISWLKVQDSLDDQQVKKLGVMAVAVKNEVIDGIEEFVEKLKLTLLKITSGPFTYPAVFKNEASFQGAYAVLDIGHKGSTLCMYRGHGLYFVRRLGFCAEKLALSLIGSVLSDKGKVELSAAQAEEIKMNFGIPLTSVVIAGKTIAQAQVLSMLRPVLENAVRDIKSSFAYFASHYFPEDVGCLFIAGASAQVKNLHTYLAKELSVPVSAMSLGTACDTGYFQQEYIQSHQGEWADCLAAATQSFPGINFLPREFSERKSRALFKTAGAAGVALLALAGLFMIIRAQLGFWTMAAKYNAAQTRLYSLDSVNTIADKIKRREDAGSLIRANHLPAHGLLRAVSSLVPAQIALSELFFDQAGRILVLKGSVFAAGDGQQMILSDFMQGLEESDYINEAGLIVSALQTGRLNFEVRCELVHEPG